MQDSDKDKLMQAATKGTKAAWTRLAQLSPVAHTFTPGVPAVPEPAGAERRAERREADAEYHRARLNEREVSQVLYAQRPPVGTEL